MSSSILTDNPYAWQFTVHDFIACDIVCNNCRYHLAGRLRQAFFMEVFL